MARRIKRDDMAADPQVGGKGVEEILALWQIPAAEATPSVRRALERLTRELDEARQDLADARGQITRLERLADHDALLPVLNRRAFVRELTRAIALTSRYDAHHTLLYLDVDHLKEINDRHGHAAGDAILAEIVATLVANVRQTDVFGRLGGDEFALILGHVDAPQAESKAAMLAEAVAARRVRCGDVELSPSVTIGTYDLTGTEEAEAAIAAADRAMYARKRRTVRR